MEFLAVIIMISWFIYDSTFRGYRDKDDPKVLIPRLIWTFVLIYMLMSILL